MGEDDFFKKRIIELADKSYRNSQFVFTDFLSPAQIDLFYRNEKACAYAGYTLFGGMEGTECQVLRFGSEENLGYEEPFPITCIVVEPLIAKFAEELSHRDYLGALMNLGIERNLLGDIVIKEKTAYVFCLEHIASYIMENLEQVRHTHMRCSETKEAPDSAQPVLEAQNVIVSSERIDGVLAKLYHLSRSQSIVLFQEKKVYVNGRLCENNSYACREGDVISVRGYGKIIFRKIVTVQTLARKT